jgi:hypothetical protein
MSYNEIINTTLNSNHYINIETKKEIETKAEINEDLLFNKIIIANKIKYKKNLNNILFNPKFNELNMELKNSIMEKINSNCNKIYADLGFYTTYLEQTNNFDIKYMPKEGKEKEVTILLTNWSNCSDKIKNINKEKNENIKNLYTLREFYFNNCLDSSKNKYKDNEEKLKEGIKKCFEYNLLESKITSELIFDEFLKANNNLKNL